MTKTEIVYWRQRIEAADARGAFTAEDRCDASAWRTCAVGEQITKFPKVVLVVDAAFFQPPKDHRLERLGVQFATAVNSEYRWATQDPQKAILEAYRILDLIEARVMELRAAKRAA